MVNRVSLLIMGIFLCALVAAAEIPVPINYQGSLTDAVGAPVTDGVYNLTFTIYDDPTLSGGLHTIWTSGSQPVTVTGGLFNYLLGSNVPFPSTITATVPAGWG
jgi:hypothetical protein